MGTRPVLSGKFARIDSGWPVITEAWPDPYTDMDIELGSIFLKLAALVPWA